MNRLGMLACALAPGLAAAQGGEAAPPLDEVVRVEGRLTSEGVECQAMRATDGTLYTLLGDLEGFVAGDEVEVRASAVEISFCMQGRTLRVHAIARRDR